MGNISKVISLFPKILLIFLRTTLYTKVSKAHVSCAEPYSRYSSTDASMANTIKIMIMLEIIRTDFLFLLKRNMSLSCPGILFSAFTIKNKKGFPVYIWDNYI